MSRRDELKRNVYTTVISQERLLGLRTFGFSSCGHHVEDKTQAAESVGDADSLNGRRNRIKSTVQPLSLSRSESWP